MYSLGTFGVHFGYTLGTFLVLDGYNVGDFLHGSETSAGECLVVQCGHIFAQCLLDFLWLGYFGYKLDIFGHLGDITL